jgi:hypothetical protein
MVIRRFFQSEVIVGLLLVVACQGPGTDKNIPSFPWEFVRIGDLDTGDERALVGGFTRNMAFGVDGSGRVSISTDPGWLIHRFDRQGAWLDTIGRRGSGPGEFQSILALSVGQTGELLVYDGTGGNYRVSHLGEKGQFIGSFHARINETSRPSLGFAGPGLFWLFDTRGETEGPGAYDSLVLLNAAGDTLWSWTARTHPYLHVSSEGRSTATLGPSFDAARWAVASDGMAWLILPRTEALLRIHPIGLRVDTIQVSIPPLVPSDEEWKEYVSHLTASMEQVRFLRSFIAPMRSALDEVRDKLHPVQRIWHVDEMGFLVERRLSRTAVEQSGNWRYAALLPDGRMSEEASGPPRLVAVGFGYAVQLNSEWRDLPRLTLWKLQPLRH